MVESNVYKEIDICLSSNIERRKNGFSLSKKFLPNSVKQNANLFKISHKLNVFYSFHDVNSLMEHYRKALLSTDKFVSVQHRLAANIIVTMRKLKKFGWVGKRN